MMFKACFEQGGGRRGHSKLVSLGARRRVRGGGLAPQNFSAFFHSQARDC